MRIVIAGGTGFIGTALVSALIRAGHDVVVLTRQQPAEVDDTGVRAADVGGSPPGSVEIVRWDPMNEDPTPAVPTHIVDGADAVVNLAGATIARRWTSSAKRLILNSRLDATRALVRAIGAAQERPRVFVSASAVGYYGPCGDELITEGSPAGDDFLAEVCKQWEAAALGVSGEWGAAMGADAVDLRAAGVRVVTARFGLILGDGGALPTMALPFKLFVGGPLGSGQQWTPWIHIDDCTGLIRHALETDTLRGPLNVTAPEPVRNEQFANMLGRVMGRPSFMPAPAFAMRAVLGEMATMVLSGQRAVPEKALAEGYRFRYTDAEAALRDVLGR